jgi:hypothetical protein
MEWSFEAGITQLEELEPWASDCSEEFPKKLVHVYYCEICNSVLSLSNKAAYPEGFLYATDNKCPTCHFNLEMSLRCRALNLRIPFNITRVNAAKRNVTLSNTFRSAASALDLSASNSAATLFSNALHRPLSFGNSSLNKFGGILPKQLTVLHGGKACQMVAEQLCVRSQLSIDAGGFDSKSVFIDGGNSFDVYHVARYASTLRLERDRVLHQIIISRAFTCYQLMNLIVEKLPDLLCADNIRLVVVANMLDMFGDPEIDLDEATRMVNFISNFLLRTARERNIAIVVTCSGRDARETTLLQFLTGRAQLVLKAVRKGRFALEKHSARLVAS